MNYGRKVVIICEHCNASVLKYASAVNRAKREGHRLFCSRTCSGLAKRLHKTEAERKAEKRNYDKQYRDTNQAMLKAKKSAYFQRAYNPIKAAIKRKKNMPRHVAYCQRPAYKAWKKSYDRMYRAKRLYGDFWESYLLSLDIEQEVLSRTDRYTMRLESGTLNKCLKRKREHERSYCKEPQDSPLGDLAAGKDRQDGVRTS